MQNQDRNRNRNPNLANTSTFTNRINISDHSADGYIDMTDQVMGSIAPETNQEEGTVENAFTDIPQPTTGQQRRREEQAIERELFASTQRQQIDQILSDSGLPAGRAQNRFHTAGQAGADATEPPARGANRARAPQPPPIPSPHTGIIHKTVTVNFRKVMDKASPTEEQIIDHYIPALSFGPQWNFCVTFRNVAVEASRANIPDVMGNTTDSAQAKLLQMNTAVRQLDNLARTHCQVCGGYGHSKKVCPTGPRLTQMMQFSPVSKNLLAQTRHTVFISQAKHMQGNDPGDQSGKCNAPYLLPSYGPTRRRARVPNSIAVDGDGATLADVLFDDAEPMNEQSQLKMARLFGQGLQKLIDNGDFELRLPQPGSTGVTGAASPNQLQN